MNLVSATGLGVSPQGRLYIYTEWNTTLGKVNGGGRAVSFTSILGEYLWETLTLVKEKCSVTRDKYYWFFSSILVLNESQLLRALTVLMGFLRWLLSRGSHQIGIPWERIIGCDKSEQRSVFLELFWGNYIKCCKKGEPFSSAAQIFSIVIQWAHRLPMKASPWVQCVSLPAVSLGPSTVPSMCRCLRMYSLNECMGGWMNRDCEEEGGREN